jgi:hypothetical protein
MKRVFRVIVKTASGNEVSLYLQGRRAREVREKLIRNGHPANNILSVTAIADAEQQTADSLGIVR